jgi:Histone chaperone Rttp106-like
VPTLDPLVFTIPTTAPKPGVISGPDNGDASSVSDDYKTLFDWAISRYLKASGNLISIVEADAKQFASVMKEAHRPTEKALFVKGFRGSKDGYLFFLITGILWGFKKPLLFLPKERIAAVSYTSVLQRTFNLNVEVYITGGKSSNNDEEEKEEYEFAMLDQEDFAGIDTYIKRHGLQDASMAEQRRAKRLGINVVKNEDGEKVDIGDASELRKAELELQDEEDEEEEDYDPGSEGESEGEGTSSEEDEDGDNGGGDEEEVDEEDEEDGEEE